MNISGKTPILVNGKLTRICGKVFNAELRKDPDLFVQVPETGYAIILSKGYRWAGAAVDIRAGKKVLASVRAVKLQDAEIHGPKVLV